MFIPKYYIPKYYVYSKILYLFQNTMFIPKYYIYSKILCLIPNTIFIPKYYVFSKILCFFQKISKSKDRDECQNKNSFKDILILLYMSSTCASSEYTFYLTAHSCVTVTTLIEIYGFAFESDFLL